MKIELISNNFTLQKEDNQYVVYLGVITPKTPRPFTIRISEVSDSSKVDVITTCGCTTSARKIIDKNNLEATLSYNNCDFKIAKTVEIINNGKKTILKIKGTCHNT